MFRSLQTLLIFFGFFFLALLTTNGDEFQSTARGGNVYANSPYMVTFILLVLGVFATMAVPSFISSAILKDGDSKFDGILYSTPISKRDYILGRFLGAFTALMAALSGAPLGMFLGCFMPWTSSENIGPVHVEHYLMVFFGFLAQTMFVVSAIVFTITSATRNLLYSYIAASGLLILYLVVYQSNLVSPLLDPFMNKVFEEQTQYWTAAERNTRMLGYEGMVLINRLIWGMVASAFFALAYRMFSFHGLQSKVKTGRESNRERDLKSSIDTGYRGLAIWDWNTYFKQFLFRARFELEIVLKSMPFLILMGFCAFLLIVGLQDREIMYGVNALPVTRIMSDIVVEGVVWLLLVVFIFYSADIIWRERKDGVSDVLDATPAPNHVFVLGKLTALLAILGFIMLMGSIFAIATQALSGYYHFEPLIYLEEEFYFILQFVFLAILACFFQVVGQGRLTGMVLMGLFLAVSVGAIDILGMEHPLLKYGLGGGFGKARSDMNGAGRFLVGGYWLRAYWAAIGGFLLMFTYLLWNRGTLQPLKYRIRAFTALKSKAFALPALLLLCLLVGSGSYIFYNTNVLNTYVTEEDKEALRVAYEEKYRQYENLPMPRTVDMTLEIDIYPEQTRVDARGRSHLLNKSGQPIHTIHLVFPGGSDIHLADLEDAELRSVDDVYHYYIFDLKTPMNPGSKRALKFELTILEKGFPHSNPNTTLVRNGTFLTNNQLTPHVGFLSKYLLQDKRKREKHGLPPLPRLPDLDDPAHYAENVNRQDSDFIEFEAIVSTTAGQTTVAPGRLVSEWEADGRRYFNYKMDRPIINFYAFLSADYETMRDEWQGAELEIYYHKPHSHNLKSMMDGMKDSLAYFGEAFSPYQYKQVRILEFPAYRAFAQSFPNTIPYSEGMGFIADVGEHDIDMPYYVTVHEMAHQWWGMQVTAANVQGASFINETLAQYSALLVMEQRYGVDKIRSFLRYELEQYLSGRAEDPEGELPLYRVEKQKYIHYRKGSLIMYALRDYLGVEVVNRTLRRLIEQRAYSCNPYTVSTDFLKLLKEQAGPNHLGLIEDFFEKITLYDLRMNGCRVETLADGNFKVSLDVTASKYYEDALGVEQASPFNIPVDIGLFLEDPSDPKFSAGQVLLLEKQTLSGGRSTLELVVSQKPRFAGIDPYHKLIDRNLDDNLVEVESGAIEVP